ncbi:glycosyltransferase family 4 protein [Methylobacterium isbiliense]|uniref:Phosphatidyl-myo-inositol mannosyltransferase n=1 Tax=Methylobacterium isbiliense TaxID=315478 RepID=A0ABQ4SM51_9HYPH|nr:glycosyltransferase family 4 protein [Methylobacterium isbiliense]MDN3625931.1 glycosyltransferase family 4 protein [Methylobacterium isbiliense]GJE04197.1 Phosphatidyl-myo-inositol mannosyltransferase [Methylobacterium isbiliense]
MLHDLSHRLAARGHDVTVLTSSPAPEMRIEADGPVRRVLLRRRTGPAAITGRWLNSLHLFGWDLAKWLVSEQFDAVHCLNYHDAVGALLARRAGARFRLVFQCTGIPVRRYFRRIPGDGLLFRTAVRHADAVAVLSRFARAALARDYGVVGDLLASPTEITPFALLPDEAPREPYILFSGDADEPRKGARLLAQAFSAVTEQLPTLRLVYTGRASPATRAAVYDAVPDHLRDRVEFLGLGRVEDLPRLYARATVCVNPAVWEALGNVLIEALAAGTPVVGARHAGIPDIITDETIGALFEPGATRLAATNAAGLSDAIVRAAALAPRAETRARCRARAQAFSWSALIPRYEGLLGGDAPPREVGLSLPTTIPVR